MNICKIISKRRTVTDYFCTFTAMTTSSHDLILENYIG